MHRDESCHSHYLNFLEGLERVLLEGVYDSICSSNGVHLEIYHQNRIAENEGLESLLDKRFLAPFKQHSIHIKMGSINTISRRPH